MPAQYEKVRDACIAKLRKESGQEPSTEQIKECKKKAAIWYFKQYGKPVSESKGSFLFTSKSSLLDPEESKVLEDLNQQALNINIIHINLKENK